MERTSCLTHSPGSVFTSTSTRVRRLMFRKWFRTTCEVTLRLMRDQREPLMSVLKTFLHDPLVEWSEPKGRSKTQASETGEIVNEKAKTHVCETDQRLQGVIKSRHKVLGLPLSIEGHVHYLIQEATDDKLLCQMYLGWGPYL